MSDQTKDAVEDAIRAHVMDESHGSYLTAWQVQVAAALPDDAGSTEYQYFGSEDPLHVSYGLLAMGQRYLDRWQTEDPA